jgi:hypothetical protein
MDLREVDGTDSGSCPMASFGISGADARSELCGAVKIKFVVF